MLNTLLRLSSIDVKIVELHVAIGAVCPTLNLYAPLDWFHGHVLLEGGSSFIFYYCLIYSLFTARMIIDLEVWLQVFKKLTYLEKFVKVLFSRSWHLLIVYQVQITPNFKKPVSGHNFHICWNTQDPVRWPVISKNCSTMDAHSNKKA